METEKIKYSILIPAYNTAKYIERCLISIFNQTFLKNTEIIVCDDGSNDETYQILQKYEDKIKLLKNSVNQGALITRNKLIKESIGEYIIWIDSDDTIEPDFLKITDQILSKEKLDIIEFSYYIIEKSNEKHIINLGNKNIYNTHCLDVFFNLKNKFFLWSKVIRREIMVKAMPPDQRQAFDDVFFTIPVYYYCKKYYSVSTPLYNYSLGIGYWSSTNNFENKITLEKFIKICDTRKDEFTYNASFLDYYGLYEQYKYKLLECCDLNSLYFYLIKIEDYKERMYAFVYLNKLMKIGMTVRSEKYPL